MRDAPGDEDATPSYGWAANERDRLAIGIEATPAERLRWLEEMIRLAYRTGALPRPAERQEESR
jgi:hypothetical protein